MLGQGVFELDEEKAKVRFLILCGQPQPQPQLEMSQVIGNATGSKDVTTSTPIHSIGFTKTTMQEVKPMALSPKISPTTSRVGRSSPANAVAALFSKDTVKAQSSTATSDTIQPTQTRPNMTPNHKADGPGESTQRAFVVSKPEIKTDVAPEIDIKVRTYVPGKLASKSDTLASSCISQNHSQPTFQSAYVPEDSATGPSLQTSPKADTAIPGCPSWSVHQASSGSIQQSYRYSTSTRLTIRQNLHADHSVAPSSTRPPITISDTNADSTDNMAGIDPPKGPVTRDLYFPFPLHYDIFVKLERILANGCFQFATQQSPEVLAENGWEHASAVELTNWIPIFKTGAGYRAIPDVIENDLFWGDTLSDVLDNFNTIHDVTVHRTRITAKATQQSVWRAHIFLHGLNIYMHGQVMSDFVATMEEADVSTEDNGERCIDTVRREFQYRREVLDREQKRREAVALQRFNVDDTTCDQMRQAIERFDEYADRRE
ncbi:uncharacterized protein DNG_04682 [Cephalotrichum gorgonifer]|uniref:Uncharacterized protein n=1 Tax=Cephalotrichum gorgonifer TaxID=2041049 RepID=A0AAE8SV52_9PEZI|nr:uncharacterized protein DNG_04682 [Cephalotrichum gorgonifer]